MNVFSHVIVARFVCSYLKQKLHIELEEKSFVYGNVKPDLAPSLAKYPHFKPQTFEYVIERVRTLCKISAISTRAFSRGLGVICHFFTDFFCFAHSGIFAHAKLRHLSYESKQQVYGHRKGDQFELFDYTGHIQPCFTVRDLKQSIQNLHDAYSEENHGYGVDFIYSITACLNMITSVFAIIGTKAVHAAA